jgi:hypothetical protein
MDCPSSFTVTIPKSVSLDSNGEARYTVSVSGSIYNNLTLVITPGTQIIMKERNSLKPDVTGTITQYRTTFTSSELEQSDDAINASGLVSVPGLSAGTWTGQMIFTITLADN